MFFGLKTNRMTKQFILASICLICVNRASSQYLVDRKALPGTYHFYNNDSIISWVLTINVNGSFSYSKATDLYKKSSTGHWTLNRDTLFLTSRYQMDNIGLDVVELTSPGDGVEFNVIKNLTGKVFSTALIYVNNDTNKAFDPLNQMNKLPRGSVRTIQVTVGSVRSKIYTVKNIRATRFSIVLRLDGRPEDYLFLDRSKFLLRGRKIYPLINNHFDSVLLSNSLTSVPLSLTK